MAARMHTLTTTDEFFLALHRAGWSIGDTAFEGEHGLTWLVYRTRAGYEVRAEDGDRNEAWRQVYRQAESLGLVEPS
jgi:hypothetical protein